MTQLAVSDLRYGFFDARTTSAFGADLRERYQGARPFPHIVLDGLFDEDMLDACLAHFPTDAPATQFSRPQEVLKSSWNPDSLDPVVRSLFYSFNSRPFIKFMENMTGINGLIPDPYFLGGGFHETKNGGKLDVHTDFNHHAKMNLERRLNLLVYLNRDWREEYGGCLELWNADMTKCEQKIVPQFNRAVVFSTSGLSWHGHPEPVHHPSEVPRRSIALYYYTSTWDDELSRAQSTQFKPRPNSTDQVDYGIGIREAVREWFVPPGYYRLARRLLGRR